MFHGLCLLHLFVSVFICGFSSMNTRKTLRLLKAYESRNVTFVDPDGGWPIVWAKAKGWHVWDVEGR